MLKFGIFHLCISARSLARQFRGMHSWNTKRWRKRRQQLTVHRGAPYWSRRFNAIMPSSDLLRRDPGRGEAVETGVPVRVGKTSHTVLITALFKCHSGCPLSAQNGRCPSSRCTEVIPMECTDLIYPIILSLSDILASAFDRMQRY